MKYLKMPGRAQGLHASAAGKIAPPRELGSRSIEARARPEGRSRRLKKRLVLQCNIEPEVKKSTHGSSRPNFPRLDMEVRSLADSAEQRRLGRRHPHLAAASQAREQCRAAL